MVQTTNIIKGGSFLIEDVDIRSCNYTRGFHR